MGATASGLVRVKQLPQSDLPPAQKTFARLQRKIESLQKKERELTEELDEALQFYQESIYPLEKASADLLAERVRIVYQFYKKKRKFSRLEKEVLSELIAEDIDGMMQLVGVAEFPEDVKQIFKDLNGSDCVAAAREELGEIKSDLEAMFKDKGIDVNDQEEEIIRKLFLSFDKAVEGEMDRFSAKKQTEKQRKKQLKQNAIEEMQKKSLNSVFRQLAKALHPDLESDSTKKAEKVELMKQVTEAYQKKDLRALLALELTWISGLDDATSMRNPEQLKIYNKILKGQVEALQARLHFLWDSPEYYRLHRFYPDSFVGIWTLHEIHRKFCKEEQRFRQLMEHLRTPAAELILRQAIQERCDFSVSQGH